MASQFSLLKTSRFLPIFVVQFLGAFNDNLLKTILVVMIAYNLWDIGDWDPGILVAVATGIFILPFILFSPLAGTMSDKFDKAIMVKWIKLAEILIAVLGVIVLHIGDLYLAFSVLLLLGTQSAFFAPCKFSILPDHLKQNELIGGNALVTTGTYLAILAGTIIGAILAPLDNGKMIGGSIIIAMAVAGYVAALRVPPAPSKDPNIKISYNIFAKALSVIQFALQQDKSVFISILGVAYFYFVAATFHAQFPNFTKQTLGADNIVLTAFMIIFSVGVAVGGLLNHKILKAQTHGGFVPLACVFMGIFGIDIFFAAKAYPARITEELDNIILFATNIHGARLLIDTFLQAVACGFFVVPLRAIVQDRTNKSVRARVVSSSNMTDALLILASAALSTILLAQGLSIEGLYLTVSIMTLVFGLFLFSVPTLRANYKVAK